MAADRHRSGYDQLDDHSRLLFRPVRSVQRIRHYLCPSALASRSIGRIGLHATANREDFPEPPKAKSNLGHYHPLRPRDRPHARRSGTASAYLD